MKKLIIAVSLFAFGNLNAQNTTKKTNSNDESMVFGVKGGLNISGLKTNVGLGATNTSTGFHIGGIGEIKLNDKIAIQVELLYSQEGGEYNYTDTFSTATYTSNQKIKLSKIDLPILFKYYATESLSFDAGPQLDYILSAKSETNMSFPAFNLTIQNSADMSENSSNYLIANSSSSSTDIGNNDFGLKKLNFGFNIGGTYNLKNNMFLQMRYTVGLTEFTNNANVAAAKGGPSNTPLIDAKYSGTAFKSNNFQISVGYKFD